MENAIERAVVVEKGRQVKLADLPFVDSGEKEAESGKLSLEEVERQHISRILAAEGGNISNTAKVLGINRTTLYHKIKKYGIST
jgi:transcriptional regulator of acetoin/glycerol metabolism